jgi:serine protease AprX
VFASISAEGFSPRLVEQARRRTRDELGSELEAKATDDFCLAIGLTSRSTFAEVLTEAVTEAVTVADVHGAAIRLPMHTTPAILELATEPAAIAEPPADPAGKLAATVREGIAALLQAGPTAETGLRALLRQTRIKAARESFYRRAGFIRDDLERATSAVMQGSLGRPHTAQEERLLVELCWLNQTMRTADARSISDVAADPAVRRVDIPRRLEQDAVALDGVLRAAKQVRADRQLTGKGVTVAVIDSEVALGHPALQDRVIHRRNYTLEPWGAPAAHGTAIAGIIGASSEQYAGVAPEATIYNYKVLASHLASNSSDFEGALAIQHALEDGADVANCSWGNGPARDGTSREARACDGAWAYGLTIVKSAGNKGPGRETLTTPADAGGVIVVGATDDEGQAVQPYSSRGPTQGARQRPHLLAPGGEASTGLEGLLPGGGIGNIRHGTSYAAPHVAGLLALLLESEPELSPTEQRDRLLQSCRELSGISRDEQGSGVISPELLFP